MTSAHVVVVEPFLGGSHQAWAEGWRAHSRHDITILGHEARHWRWRMRGAAVTLAQEMADVAAGRPPDLIVASNMLDLASFLGLTRRSVGSVPAVVYLHENQLSYPRQTGEPLDHGLAWMQWRGLAVADEVWCNSGFHRSELLAGVDLLLDAALDHGHEIARAALPDKVWVSYPGIDLASLRPAASDSASGPRPLIVSNQRWHHDKDVGSVVRAMRRLVNRGFDVDLAVVGDADGGEADTIDPLLDELGPRLVARGRLPRRDYVDLLRRADVVVSAARGENFGIAVVEAIAAGAWPVVPAGLAYPEVIPAEYHERCLYEPGGLGRQLEAVVSSIGAGESVAPGLTDAMANYAWPVVAAELDDRVDAVRRGLGVS